MKLTTALLSLALSGATQAQSTLLVPQDHATIQAAIEAAVPGDTVLVAPGTYIEQIDFRGKAIEVRSEAGAECTTIDSQGGDIWFDAPPYSAVVRMINGEGRLSILRGFTITGSSDGMHHGGGVYCKGLSPSILDCIIDGNLSVGGAGVQGDALIERCTITNNIAFEGGGGVWGNAHIVDSVISNNRSRYYPGGGIYAHGSTTVTRCVIDSNTSGTSFEGYTGGGIFGPAVVTDSLITRNTANHYNSGGYFDTLGTGVDGAKLLQRCTIADNKIFFGPVTNEQSGGIRNVGIVESCILWNNEGQNIAIGSQPVVRFSTVGGGFPGTGNIALDPLFKDPANGDYFLTFGSPAIDAASPSSPLDPDGTPADMGALTFPQFPAAITTNNGSGINPGCFTTLVSPAIGTTWTGSVDANAHGFAGDVVTVLGYAAPLAALRLGFGELLVDPASPQIFSSVEMPIAGVSQHSLPVPANYALGGLTVHTQALVVDALGNAGLCNALELTLGL